MNRLEMNKLKMNGWKALGFETYSDYLNSVFWKDKREHIIETFGNKCSNCEAKMGLQVHHLSYANVGNEQLEDVIVLCRSCHYKLHKNEDDEDGKICS